MGHHYEIELKAHPAEARRARACAREQLAYWGLEELIETAELLVSELVGNAVVHTTAPARLRLSYEHIAPHVLRLEVTDACAREPRPSHPAPDDIAGRGLELVGLFSDRWDWHTHDDGKTVWCELNAPVSAPA